MTNGTVVMLGDCGAPLIYSQIDESEDLTHYTNISM